MSKTSPRTVKETGARAEQFLIGIEEHPLNRGLRIKIHQPQEPGDGGRVKGSFDLVAEGTGTYAQYLRQYIGESFLSAAELINRVRKQGGKALDCTHFLNCHKLRVNGNQR